jgi:thiamine-phosphate pyrophosphorylase
VTPAGRDRQHVPRLHVLTDDRPDDALLALVDAVLAAGAPCVQVRSKRRSDRDLVAIAAEVAARCHAAGAWCVVNDRVDVALAAGADAVHLGADDLPVAVARDLAGDRLVLGATVRDPDAARAAVAAGAGYLGVGPVHATTTKAGLPDPLGPDGVAQVASAVSVPVVAIAGITAERVGDVRTAGAHGVAVVGAVTDAPDPAAAVRDLLAALAPTALERTALDGRGDGRADGHGGGAT